MPGTRAGIAAYGGPVGSLATIVCKPRQGRKAATVVNDSGAGMQLAGLPPLIFAFVPEREDHEAAVLGHTFQQEQTHAGASRHSFCRCSQSFALPAATCDNQRLSNAILGAIY